VYYVRDGPGADSINFHDPRSQAGVIRPPVTELTAANTDQVVVRVKDGTLLVFPSYLYHSVDPVQRRDTRKPELQPDVFQLYCCIEQAVVGR
jgi:Putative 2OG-Fe(II) oxygenase